MTLIPDTERVSSYVKIPLVKRIEARALAANRTKSNEVAWELEQFDKILTDQERRKLAGATP